jgi:hypothetical protein
MARFPVPIGFAILLGAASVPLFAAAASDEAPEARYRACMAKARAAPGAACSRAMPPAPTTC